MAQSKPATKQVPSASAASPHTLIAVNVTGTHYQSADIVAAAGLHLGEEVSEASFKAATAKLGETGLFTDIAYSYSYSVAGTKLDLQLAENNELVPVRFENFVWYSDQELIDKMRAQLGLFEGKVPVSGSLVDQLATALSGLLVEHGPQLHATYLRASPSPDSPKIDSVVYSVSGAPIRIRKIFFEGANPTLAPLLAQVAKKVEGGEYLRSKLAFFADLDARTVFLKHGYLKVSFGDVQPQVVGEQADSITVDLKLPVNEGLQYRVANVSWSGNHSFHADELARLLHVVKDEPADAVRLQEDLAGVRKLYGTRGYIKAAITPRPEFSEAEASVVYDLAVEEGDVYRLGEVEIDGLDDKAKARLREDWRLREGEPYDQSYPERFLRESQRDLPPGTRWKITPHESINEDDKTVDVTITYVPGN